jgi:hypothetical protein
MRCGGGSAGILSSCHPQSFKVSLSWLASHTAQPRPQPHYQPPVPSPFSCTLFLCLQVDLLKSKGIDEEDATRVIDIVAKEEHKDFFVDHMVRHSCTQHRMHDLCGSTCPLSQLHRPLLSASLGYFMWN